MTPLPPELERYRLQRAHFDQALARLEDALAQPETEYLRDAIIQRFEFTFEMGWKTLFRYLLLKGERIAAKAWDVLPAAFEARLIDDADSWMQLREHRNDTSHEYDQDKAAQVVQFLRGPGIAALRGLEMTMRERE
jgi:nucleotidyltransferase substrate binding protein (TIGR01987 family)